MSQKHYNITCDGTNIVLDCINIRLLTLHLMIHLFPLVTLDNMDNNYIMFVIYIYIYILVVNNYLF